MADIDDVNNSLVAMISQVLYPNGIGNAPAAGVPCVTYQGWPIPAQLEADLAAGKVHVSVFAGGNERNTTRYNTDWQQLSVNTPTLTVVISGQTITIGGAVSVPQNVAAIVNGKSYTYAVQANDTLTSIATALAALIAAGVSGTTSSGAVITMPTSAKIKAARIGVAGTLIREIRRQERIIQIVIWANDPTVRTTVASLIDNQLAATERFTLPDQSSARLIYRNTIIIDKSQKTNLFRRDLNYLVEYATTQTQSNTQITTVQENITNQPDGATAVISSIQINT